MNISILGAGWLGLPLGGRLARNGHHVRGTTTRPGRIGEINEAGIAGHLLNLEPEPSDPELLEDLLDCEALVIAFPPGRGREDVVEFHPAQVAAILASNNANLPRAVYHVSTTGVYGSGDGQVDEESPINPSRPSAIAVARVEDLLRSHYGEKLTTIRPAGLMGWGRHGVRMMAGKRDLPGGDNPVNLVAGEDVVEVLVRLIEGDVTNGIFNVCSDGHPTRQAFYTSEALKLGLDPPTFLPGKRGDAKIVLAEKIKSFLSIEWKYPDPAGIYQPGDRL